MFFRYKGNGRWLTVSEDVEDLVRQKTEIFLFKDGDMIDNYGEDPKGNIGNVFFNKKSPNLRDGTIWSIFATILVLKP